MNNPEVQQTILLVYHKSDQKYADNLKDILKPLERDRGWEIWDENSIPPGSIRQDEVNLALARASVAVLLVSPEFLAMTTIQESLVAPLLPAAIDDRVLILWLTTRECLVDLTPIGEFEPAADLTKPLATQNSAYRAKVFRDVARKIAGLSEGGSAPRLRRPGGPIQVEHGRAITIISGNRPPRELCWNLPNLSRTEQSLISGCPVSWESFMRSTRDLYLRAWDVHLSLILYALSGLNKKEGHKYHAQSVIEAARSDMTRFQQDIHALPEPVRGLAFVEHLSGVKECVFAVKRSLASRDPIELRDGAMVADRVCHWLLEGIECVERLSHRQ